jgi:hypothetical protein
MQSRCCGGNQEAKEVEVRVAKRAHEAVATVRANFIFFVPDGLEKKAIAVEKE